MKKLFRAFGYPEVVWLPKGERTFLTFICLSFIAAMFASPYPHIAMWAGFLFAAYAAIANDSIQTIGTFIASNQDKKWWVLWIFIAGIFIGTMSYSWYTVDESGLTVFTPKLEKVEQEKYNKEIIANLKLNLSKKDNNYITWNIKGTDSDGATNYTSSYMNEDYGTCFFLNAKNELCHI